MTRASPRTRPPHRPWVDFPPSLMFLIVDNRGDPPIHYYPPLSRCFPPFIPLFPVFFPFLFFPPWASVDQPSFSRPPLGPWFLVVIPPPRLFRLSIATFLRVPPAFVRQLHSPPAGCLFLAWIWPPAGPCEICSLFFGFFHFRFSRPSSFPLCACFLSGVQKDSVCF